MFNRRNKIEIVDNPTDFSESKYATKKTVIAAIIPFAVLTPIMVKSLTSAETYTPTIIPASAPAIISTLPSPTQIPSMPVSATIAQMPPVIGNPTGLIADKSLEVLANVLDPLLQIMVAISFPIASVIMVGSCFHFMFGNNEKAWDSIMKAGLGYVLIQLSPLFLKILRQVGESVA